MVELGNTTVIAIAPGSDTGVQKYAEEALSILRWACEMAVADLEGEKRATNDLVLCRSAVKAVEAERRKWLEPVKAAEKKIRDAFDSVLAPLKAADETLTGKITTFRKEERRKADEALEIACKKAELEALEAKAEGREALPPEPMPVIVQPPKTVRSDAGTTTGIINWKWRRKAGPNLMQILQALPLEYHMLDETKIGQAVRGKNKTGITEADFGGVIEIYAEEGIRITGKRE